MRVDAVITWVDGSDPYWRVKRAGFTDTTYTLNQLATSNVEGRFRDNGELRYLLRSLERFWPFEGYIYIVTDEQKPDFLGDNPRIKVIDHRDFIDKESLPTFSSRAIEASLHKIPGLSDYFVSFNDDVFLSRPVVFEDFFGERGCRVYVTPEDIPELSHKDILSGHNDALNAHFWVEQHYGTAGLRKILDHYPKGIRKDWMNELERAHPEMFRDVREEKFRRRSGQSILANVYPEWCASQGRAEVVPSQSLYLYSDDIEHAESASKSVASAMNRCLSVCINDTTDNRTDLELFHQRYHRLMGSIFRNPSSFERSVKASLDIAELAF